VKLRSVPYLIITADDLLFLWLCYFCENWGDFCEEIVEFLWFADYCSVLFWEVLKDLECKLLEYSKLSYLE
jgi:hypothetical protein